MNVPGIVLHEVAEEQLDKFLGKPTTGVLLGGPVGSGKTLVAAKLTQKLLGTEALENHPYFRRLHPLNRGITIGQIRELIRFFQLKVPGKAKVKRVAILEDADTMSLEAQNALLKLLEEPPADSVLILTSSYPQRLLPTIRSRAQLFMLMPPNPEKLKAHFVAQGYVEQAISIAMLRAGTNIAEMAYLLSTPEDDMPVKLVKETLGGNIYERLLVVNGLTRQKEAVREFLETLQAVAMASLQTAARQASITMERWKNILVATQVAQEAFEKNGNTKIILTELMLAL